EYEAEPATAALLPKEIARRYAALPIGFLPDGSLRVVVADPTNVLYSDELHLALGGPLSLAAAAPNAIPSRRSPTSRRPPSSPRSAAWKTSRTSLPSKSLSNPSLPTSHTRTTLRTPAR